MYIIKCIYLYFFSILCIAKINSNNNNMYLMELQFFFVIMTTVYYDLFSLVPWMSLKTVSTVDTSIISKYYNMPIYVYS